MRAIQHQKSAEEEMMEQMMYVNTIINRVIKT
jgi:hypothetical protein